MRQICGPTPTLVHVGVVQRAERVEAIAEQPEYQLVASRLDAAEVQSERVERDYALVLAVEEYPHERAAVLGYPRDQLAVGSFDFFNIVDIAGVEGQRLRCNRRIAELFGQSANCALAAGDLDSELAEQIAPLKPLCVYR